MFVNLESMQSAICGLLYAAAILLVVSIKKSSGDGVANTWAILVGTSRYWYNYRHVGNVVGLYNELRRNGVQDSHIIVMHGDDYVCSSQNPLAGRLYLDRWPILQNEIYSDTEVDFKGEAVTVANFLKLLTNRWPADAPDRRKLLTNSNSTILIYLTGHGGDGFIKFQDWEVLASGELADAVQQMATQHRFGKMWIVVDSCQASTLGNSITTPNVIVSGSSRINENSYGYNDFSELGVPLVDKFTWELLEFLKKGTKGGAKEKQTVFELLKETYKPAFLNARPLTKHTIHFRNASIKTEFADGNAAPLQAIALTHFFTRMDYGLERLKGTDELGGRFFQLSNVKN